MTSNDQLTLLNKALERKENKQKKLTKEFTQGDLKGEDRTRFFKEINALAVSIQTIKYKISNISVGIPQLGYELPLEVTDKTETKKRKQI